MESDLNDAVYAISETTRTLRLHQPIASKEYAEENITFGYNYTSGNGIWVNFILFKVIFTDFVSFHPLLLL